LGQGFGHRASIFYRLAQVFKLFGAERNGDGLLGEFPGPLVGGVKPYFCNVFMVFLAANLICTILLRF